VAPPPCERGLRLDRSDEAGEETGLPGCRDGPRWRDPSWTVSRLVGRFPSLLGRLAREQGRVSAASAAVRAASWAMRAASRAAAMMSAIAGAIAGGADDSSLTWLSTAFTA
jgi:hypothetical protein